MLVTDRGNCQTAAYCNLQLLLPLKHWTKCHQRSACQGRERERENEKHRGGSHPRVNMSPAMAYSICCDDCNPFIHFDCTCLSPATDFVSFSSSRQHYSGALSMSVYTVSLYSLVHQYCTTPQKRLLAFNKQRRMLPWSVLSPVCTSN